MALCGRGNALILVAAWFVSGCSIARAEVRPLTFYQNVARAALVVRARATSDSTRRPTMEVLEVYKGFYPARSLTIVPFFQDYANPKPWLHREVFRKGEESILFLAPYEGDRDTAFHDPASDSNDVEDAAERLFVLLNADQGKVAIPSEGATALTDTIRRVVEILALGQSDRQTEALRSLLREHNPYLLEAGLNEVARFDLAREEDSAALVEILKSPRDEFREKALVILGQVGLLARQAGGELRERKDVFSQVAARAYKDSSPAVRSEAVRALARIGGEGVVAALEVIRSHDADQKVRYDAGVAILALSESRAH